MLSRTEVSDEASVNLRIRGGRPARCRNHYVVVALVPFCRRSGAVAKFPSRDGGRYASDPRVRGYVAGLFKQGEALEHDPVKWTPVFPHDKRKAFARRSCSNSKIERDDDSKKNNRSLDPERARSTELISQQPAELSPLRAADRWRPIHRASLLVFVARSRNCTRAARSCSEPMRCSGILVPGV
jgi:hypothetical protein